MVSAENWPNAIGADEQWALAGDMLAEFSGYLQDHGIDARVRDGGGGEKVLELTWEGAPRRVSLLRTAVAATGGAADIAVVLDATEALPFAAAWFDLLGRRKGGTQDPVVEETELFINRWGVRFERVGE
jgi:hypothetical protein